MSLLAGLIVIALLYLQFAEFEYSIIEVTIEDGVATIVDLAAQLDRLIIVGDGKIDLGTEELDITIRTKTREGLGLSLGGGGNRWYFLTRQESVGSLVC